MRSRLRSSSRYAPRRFPRPGHGCAPGAGCAVAEISDAGGVIVENLVGLGAVDFPDPLVSVLPLRIAGGDGAPARAVAVEGLG